jgi:exonuclease III
MVSTHQSPKGNVNTAKGIVICCWNVEGLTSEKLDHRLLGDYVKGFDMLLITESWGIKGLPINIPNYKVLPYPRQRLDPKAKRASGGIAIYIKENLVNHIKPLSNYFDNLVWLSISADLAGTEKPIALATVYFPPEGSTHNCDKEDYFCRLEHDCARLRDDFHIAICGDLNARTTNISEIPLDVIGTEGDLENLTNNNGCENYQKEFPDHFNIERVSQDMKTVNEYGKKLIEMCKACNMRILNGRSFQDKVVGKLTRVETTGCSVVDYLVCDAYVAEKITAFKVEEKMPESDHCALVFSLHSTSYNVKSYSIDIGEDSFKYKWNKDSIQGMHTAFYKDQSLEDLALYKDSMGEMQNVNMVADKWLSYFTGVIEQTCTKTKCKKRVNIRAPWVDDECIELRTQIRDTKVVNQNMELTRGYRKVKQRKKRAYRNKNLHVLNEACGKNSKLFWETLKSLPSAKPDSEILNKQKVCDQLQELANMPKMSYFDRVYEQQAEEFLNKYDRGELQSTIDNTLELEILNHNISLQELENAVKKLKSGKSAGLDMIPAELVKYNIDHIKSDLLLLYNYVLNTGDYPATWAEGLRVALPKDGGDIRPITIEPIFGKILETIIDNRLNFINEAFCKNDRYNGGFLKGSMTQDNMLTLLGCIQKQTQLGKCLYIAFVDFKKAFNYINRKLLFYKIIKAGKFGKTIDLLRNMYTKIRARVKINGSFFDWIEDKCGTNQGGPLSPNMFRTMLSDLKNYFNTNHGIVISELEILTHILWADDLAIVSDSERGLNEQLEGLFKFCCHNQMIVNEVKTKVVIFGKRGGQESFIFNNKKLDIVEKYKYLGNIFNSIISPIGNPFREMSTYLTDKALKAYFAALKTTSSVGFLPPKVSFHLFDSCVLPVLEYGSEIWGNCKKNIIMERVQLKFLKLALRVKGSTCTTALYGETGRFPLLLRQKVKLVQYWLRLQALPEHMIVKQVYIMLRNMDNIGYRNWTTNVREVLVEYDLEEMWHNENILKSESPNCIKTFKDRVYQKYMLNWYSDIQNFPSMRSYVLFKKEFCMESYLLNITDQTVRKALSKFRLSSHSLEIEKGRHCKPKLSVGNRICKVCKQGEIEDEQHMVTGCVLYGDLRKTLFDVIQKSKPEIFTGPNVFYNIMSCKDIKIQFSLGKFLIKAFKKRDNTLNTTVLAAPQLALG